MKAKAFSGVWVDLTGGADQAPAKADPAIECQPVLYSGFDEQQSWLSRISAMPTVLIRWRERR
jgi:hypothetical protein